ncbi:hypothetical protein [[Eubacterium] cellulosolvens]
MANRSLILIIGRVIVVAAAGIYFMYASSGPNGEHVTPGVATPSKILAR